MSLVIKKVCIGFLRNQEILIKNLTFEVKKGKTITLMGPSGCGKSTFLSYICGSLSSNFQANGEIFLDNHALTELEPEKRKIGILYQDPLLFPHMNIFENQQNLFFSFFKFILYWNTKCKVFKNIHVWKKQRVLV